MDKNQIFLQLAVTSIIVIDAIAIIGTVILFFHKVLKKILWRKSLIFLWWTIFIFSIAFFVYVVITYLSLPTPRDYAKGMVEYVITMTMLPTIIAGFLSIFLKP